MSDEFTQNMQAKAQEHLVNTAIDTASNALNESTRSSIVKIPVELKPNANGIAIAITENYNKEERLTKHTVYVIKGFDDQGVLEVSRRYSDFVKVRGVLVSRWPGCYIPPLPTKNLLNNLEPAFIKERREGLDLFLQKMATVPFLYHSTEFQTFIRYSGADLSREWKVYQKVSYEEMVARYASTFQHLSQIQSAEEAVILITRFKAFLNKTASKFKYFKNISEQAVKAKKNYYSTLANFQTSVMAEYEKEAIAEYKDHRNLTPVFYQENNVELDTQANKLKEASTKPSVEHFSSWLSTECLEIESLIESVQQREKYEGLKTKTEDKIKSLLKDIETVAGGKFHWKTIFAKDKEAETLKFQRQIDELKKDVENLTLLIDMITLIIAYDEIEKFKSSKPEKFYQLINGAAQAELENINTVGEYWNIILRNNNRK